MIKICVIEDGEMLREDLVCGIAEMDSMEVVSEFDSIESFLKFVDFKPDHNCDLILLDIGLPGMSGIEGLPLIRKQMPHADVVILSSFGDRETIVKALCNGAVGYIAKGTSPHEIERGIRTVKNGGSYLSPEIAREIVSHLFAGPKGKRPEILSDRQFEILERLSTGSSYGSIANELCVSIETIRTHIKKMYRLLEVNNKAEAIAIYLKG